MSSIFPTLCDPSACEPNHNDHASFAVAVTLSDRDNAERERRNVTQIIQSISGEEGILDSDLTAASNQPTIIDLSLDSDVETLSSGQEDSDHTDHNKQSTIIDLLLDSDSCEEDLEDPYRTGCHKQSPSDKQAKLSISHMLAGVKRKLDSTQNGVMGVRKKFKEDMMKFEDSLNYLRTPEAVNLVPWFLSATSVSYLLASGVAKVGSVSSGQTVSQR
ncbi:hypothetical protein GYMLUDRAFT_247572 [Collybiopsis luxurians FD-317 M1]|uniref:Uncharacterized protein n=1 Tax=Collybiopsis luxurians FD-317 M1 TaxID=944289 RepID=A0A0D0BP03_9AGAR|nr:hypothetical protein GYMLUDRAFT_247572 [Collybiopsis luxurians FD-317 M1]